MHYNKRNFLKFCELIVGCVCVCGREGEEFQVALKFEYIVCACQKG